MVPFRHSKVTELFHSFFAGEGRAAMIVNVNPYDTGYDENLHVMKFSAVAQEVTVTKAQIRPPRSVYSTPRQSLSHRTPLGTENSIINGAILDNVIILDSDSDVEIVEELTAPLSEDEGEEEDVFVEHLLDQIRELRIMVRLLSVSRNSFIETFFNSWPNLKCGRL